MIVGNKSDKPENKREVSIQQGDDLAKKLGCMFTETSAKENINVQKAFFDVVEALHGSVRLGMSEDVASPKCPAWGSWIGKGIDRGCCVIM